ncbi:MAG: tetratricopeptide repeat protein, partial [Methanobacterium sp.]
MHKKAAIIAVLVLVFAGAGFFWWSQGSAGRAQEKMDLAVKYISQNNFEKAILSYNEAIKIDPKAADAYMGLAKVYTLQGQYDQARSTYEQGLVNVESNELQNLQLGLAGMYIDQEKMDQAEKSFQNIIDSNSACLEAYWGLAMVYQQQGDNLNAETFLKQAIKKNPKEYRSYNMLALFLSQNGQRDQAFENLVKSLSLEINQQEAYLVLKDLFEGEWSQLSAKAAGISDEKIADMLTFYSAYAARDYQNAVKMFESRFSDQTDNHKAQILAAIAFNKTGNADRGQELIARLASKKVDGWLLSDIAEYYLVAGDKEKARLTAINALEA